MKVTGICGFVLIHICVFIEGFSDLKDEREYSLLKKLTATCGKDGIKVSVRFSEPFFGIVYSDGYYDKPQCIFINQENFSTRLIATEAAETKFSFLIPPEDCGTVFHDPGSSLSSQFNENNATLDKNELANEVYMENTVMFQKNHFIQEQGDVLHKLRCVWQKEIRLPLRATLPLRGKHREKAENVKVVRPKELLSYKKVLVKQSISQPHDFIRPTSTQEISTSSLPATKRYSSQSRKRFQPVGQVESVTQFHKYRRDGKSLANYPLSSSFTKENFISDIETLSSLQNLTALPFRQDDVSKSGSTTMIFYHTLPNMLIIVTMKELSYALFRL